SGELRRTPGRDRAQPGALSARDAREWAAGPPASRRRRTDPAAAAGGRRASGAYGGGRNPRLQLATMISQNEQRRSSDNDPGFERALRHGQQMASLAHGWADYLAIPQAGRPHQRG